MICKYCNAQLEDGVSVCPCCGEAVQEETAQMDSALFEEETQMTAPEEDFAEEQQTETTEEPVAEEENPVEETPKKKTTLKKALTIAACVLAALIVVGAVLYACGVDFGLGGKGVLSKDVYTVDLEDGVKAADKVVAKAGGVTLTNAELQIYYWYGVENFLSYYGNYLSMTGLNPSLPLDEQIFDPNTGKTWQQHFLEDALNSWHRYTALNLLAQEEGVELSQDKKQVLLTTVAEMEQVATGYGFANAQELLQANWGSACNVDGYTRYLQTYLWSMDYFDMKFAQMQPSDQEVEAYFEEKQADFAVQGITKDSGKFVDARHILVMPKGGTKGDDGKTTYSEEEWQTCLEEAEEILDQWLAGEATEESFAALAGEYSEDGGSASNGGLYEGIYKGQMVEPFENWCFDDARQYGDYDIVKTNYGYHIMYFVNSVPQWFTAAENQLLTERTEELILSGTERWPMDVKYGKIVIGEITNVVPSAG